jgi:hypothetical protein
MFIPFCNKSHQPLCQVLLVRKISDPQAFALQNREPLLDLIRPGAMHRWQGKHKAWMFGQPGLHLLALMHPYIIEHDMDPRNGQGNLPIHILQERNAFHLLFPLGRRGLDLPQACTTTGKKVQSTLAGVLLLDPNGLAGCAARVGASRVRGCRLVFSSTYSTMSPTPSRGVYQVTIYCTCTANTASRGTLGESHRWWHQGFSLWCAKNPLDRLRLNLGDHAVMHQLSGQFGTIPLRQGPPDDIGTLTRTFHDIQGHCWGKRVGAPGVFCPIVRQCHAWQSRGPTYGHVARVTPPAWPRRQRSSRRPIQHSPRPFGQPYRGRLCLGHPVKVARVSSCISIWIAEWRPCISCPQSTSCKRHETSVITLSLFPSLFMGTCTKVSSEGGLLPSLELSILVGKDTTRRTTCRENTTSGQFPHRWARLLCIGASAQCRGNCPKVRTGS